MPKFKPYLNQKLTITPEGEIFDEEGYGVMMGFEKPLMKKTAEVICANNGDILNVGYGMGLIDNYIQSYNSNSHWIIEAHPQIKEKMCKEGWLKKPNVKCIFTKWQNVLPYLPKFDGIYIDTYGESMLDFIKNAHKLLKPNGIFSFFYNPFSPEELINSTFGALEQHFNKRSIQVEFDEVPNSQGTEPYWLPEVKIFKLYYWILKT